MSDEIEFRVWVGCLACYNKGDLVGQWYDAIEAGDVTPATLHEVEANSHHQDAQRFMADTASHEELWCFDIEAPIKEWAKEMSPMDASQLAADFNEAIETLSNCPPEAYLLWLGRRGESPSWDSARDAEERYRGEYDEFQEFADEVADEVLGCPTTPCSSEVWTAAMAELGSRMEFAINHFDWQGHARDLVLSYDVLRSPGGAYNVYIFDSSY